MAKNAPQITFYETKDGYAVEKTTKDGTEGFACKNLGEVMQIISGITGMSANGTGGSVPQNDENTLVFVVKKDERDPSNLKVSLNGSLKEEPSVFYDSLSEELYSFFPDFFAQ